MAKDKKVVGTVLGETTATTQPPVRRNNSDPGFLQRWPVRTSQGVSAQVLAMLVNPADAMRAGEELSGGPVPFRIPRLASSDVLAYGSIASQHHPYTQGGYSPSGPTIPGGVDRLPRTRVAKQSAFVFHSRIPALGDDRRARNFATVAGSPSASRMNIPASYVPTTPVTR